MHFVTKAALTGLATFGAAIVGQQIVFAVTPSGFGGEAFFASLLLFPASAGVAGWVEFLLLRRSLNRRIGRTGIPLRYTARLWGAALAGTAVAWGVKLLLPAVHPVLLASVALPPYAVVYFLATRALGVPEAAAVTRLIQRFIPNR